MIAVRTLPMIFLVSLLAACASQPLQLTDVQFDEKLAETDVKLDGFAKAGRLDEASVALKGLAAMNTARKEPWLRLARMHFENANYGEAISAADEVLQRDRSDLAAKSIRAVSGLRVAVRSLEDIRQDQSLAGAAKPDAQKLATLLREALGESELVPPAVAVEEPVVDQHRKPVQKRRVRRTRMARSAAPVGAPAAASPASVAPAPSRAASANPFGALQ